MSATSTKINAQVSLFLAIETSQRAASVALRDRSGAMHEESLSPKKRHDDDLLPAINRMFARANLRSADLRGGAVAVSIGPGGFTGLRIAVATAKMLAEALQVRLVAVPSALVAAEGTMTDQPPAISDEAAESVLVALACKNDTFWLTRMEKAQSIKHKAQSPSQALPTRSHWRIVGQPGIARSDTFDFSGVRAVIADEHFPDSARSRVEHAGIPIVQPIFAARSCLAVGERMLMQGETVDPLHLLPLYPREPEAVTLWNARSQARPG